MKTLLKHRERYIEMPNIYNTYILKGRVKIQTSYLNFGFILNFKFNTSNVQFMEKFCWNVLLGKGRVKKA